MKLSELSIKRPIFITCVVVVMLVVGAVCMVTRPVDLFPDVTFPVVSVTTIYPGAGPAEIETLISKPLEDEVSTIAGIKRLTSRNLEGTSQVIAEFRLGIDVKYAEQQVRDRVSLAKTKFPLETKEPIIKRFDPSDQPILRLALESDAPDAKVFDVADNFLKPRLTQVEDIGLIEIIGGRKREIHVDLKREKLLPRELSVQAIAAQLGAAGENIPSGKVNEGAKETIFRSLGEFKSLNEISDSLVRLYGNEVATKVSDVGTVTDTLEDEKNRVFVDGKKSIFIDVYRQSGTNTVEVAKNVKKLVTQLESSIDTMLPGAKLKIVLDASKKIQDNLDDVEETIIIGIILTVVVVFFFLANFRSTLITGMALPNSLLGAFILMTLAGFTINVVSLLALSLAIGLLIDDAIVVRENIFRHIEAGEDPVTAAKNGTNEVTLAVVATTMVVIAVFAPVAFMQGIVGQFLREFGLTICFAMAISLFDALTIAPMLSAYFAGKHSVPNEKSLWGRTGGRVLRGFDRFQTSLENIYEKILRGTIRRPLFVLAISLVVFFVCSASIKWIPKTFNPPQENGEITVDLDLPPGASLDEMNRVAAQVDDVIRKNKVVAYTVMVVGGRSGEPNESSLYVRMVPSKERKGVSTSDFKLALREQLKPLAMANPKVKDYDPVGGGNVNRAFMINIIGADQAEVEKYAQGLFTHLKADKRLTDVDTTFRPGKPEIQFRLIPEKAALYGISTRLLGAELRAQVEGVLPVKYRQNGLEYDVRVRLDPEQRDLRKAYNSIFIPNVNQKLIRLADVAKPYEVTGPATITRQDRGRYIQINADLAPGAGLDTVMADAEKYLKDALKLPNTVRYAYIGNAENFKEFGTSVLLAVAAAVLFAFLILASLYESFITPFAIMLALPLAVCGAFLAIFLAGESLTIFAVLGIIMLLGIASKNSILIIDYAAQLMREGMSRPEALVKAGKVRLRPILMTSMALIAGTLPVALGLSEASKARTSMGVGIIGGLISSTLLSLVVVPAAFLYIDRFRVWFEGTFRRVTGGHFEENDDASHGSDGLSHPHGKEIMLAVSDDASSGRKI